MAMEELDNELVDMFSSSSGLFYEKEADKVSTKLKGAIFATDLPLSRKAHLRNFVEHIDNLADKSEDVADRLSIYTIKRTI